MPPNRDGVRDPPETGLTEGRDDAFETNDGGLVVYDTHNTAAFVYSDHWTRPEA
jgi:hypothetical protein